MRKAHFSFVLLASAALAAGCGGDDTSDGAGGTAGTGGASGSGGTVADAAADAPAEAGACEPVDHWALSYAVVEAGVPPSSETVVVSQADGGGYQLTWLDRTVPQDQCSPNPDGGSDAGSEPVTVPATFDAASCTLMAEWNASWCQSGEQQCDTFELTLTFSGATATGTADWSGGWCMQKQSASYTVSGTKTN